MQQGQNQQLRPLSLAEAKQLAIDWAVENSQSGTRAAKLVESWFSEGMTQWGREALLQSLKVFFLQAKNAETLYEKLAEINREKHSSWSIEAVKHIAIASVTGLAGSATLIASNSKNSLTVSALVLFALAMALSIGAFLAAASTFLAEAKAYSDLALNAQYADSWKKLTTRPTETEAEAKAKIRKRNVGPILLLLAILSVIAGIACIAVGIWS